MRRSRRERRCFRRARCDPAARARARWCAFYTAGRFIAGGVRGRRDDGGSGTPATTARRPRPRTQTWAGKRKKRRHNHPGERSSCSAGHGAGVVQGASVPSIMRDIRYPRAALLITGAPSLRTAPRKIRAGPRHRRGCLLKKSWSLQVHDLQFVTGPWPWLEEIQRKSRVREWTPRNAPRIHAGATKKSQGAELKKNQTRRRYVEKLDSPPRRPADTRQARGAKPPK